MNCEAWLSSAVGYSAPVGQTVVDGIRSSFRGEQAPISPRQLLLLFIAIGVVLAIVGVALKIWRRHQSGEPYYSTRSLFRELSRAHNLDRPTQAALKRLARSLDLEQPGELFLSPERFAAEHLSKLPEADRAMLAPLRQKLFA